MTFRMGSNIDKLTNTKEITNSELNKKGQWLATNKLSINILKKNYDMLS